jgi:hypothetical protein
MTASDAYPPQQSETPQPGAVAAAGDTGAGASRVRNLVRMLSIRYVLSLADPYPVVVKQFLQFCLILIYPAWIVGILFSLVVYLAIYSVLWVIFWPVRAWMKTNRPEQYAASQRK